MRSKIINISLPEPLLKQIDHSASLSARTRSDFFRQAARSYLSNQAKLDADIYGWQQVDLKNQPLVNKMLKSVRRDDKTER